MSLLSCLACSLVIQSFCVSEVAGTENIITPKKSGLKGNHLFEDRKM